MTSNQQAARECHYETVVDYGPDTAEERELKFMLEELVKAYRRDSQPIIDRLAAIHAMKSPRVFLMPITPPPFPTPPDSGENNT